MKNTATPEPKSVSKKTEKDNVQPVRVSDMGMRRKVTSEGEVKQSVTATV
ncbi:hypothetical protein [Cytophaga aurantiaca]|nr:hypothetical protein [Cytophaga aurantiaca]